MKLSDEPRRIIEYDFPISVVSESGRQEKNMRKGHLWHIHIWWARRPFGVCRSVILASLLPAPIDPNCPQSFKIKAREIFKLNGWTNVDTDEKLHKTIVNFIGNFANWDISFNEAYMQIAQDLIRGAYNGEIPLVFDSFAGNGAIPVEAARMGLESIAIDLNPVANLLLKLGVEYIPSSSQRIVDLYDKWAELFKNRVYEKLKHYYPATATYKTPLAYLWARTVRCEGPNCGVEIPLISQLNITKGKARTHVNLSYNNNTHEIETSVVTNSEKIQNGTAGNGAATCPVCGYTTPKPSVKRQANDNGFGYKLFAVAEVGGNRSGKTYRDPSQVDIDGVLKAEAEYDKGLKQGKYFELTEPFPVHDTRAFTPGLYGIRTWNDAFTKRQLLAFNIMVDTVKECKKELLQSENKETAEFIALLLALSVSNTIHYNTNLSTYLAEHMISIFIQGQSIAMRWDFAEANPLVPQYVGGIDYALSQTKDALVSMSSRTYRKGTVTNANAAELPLPDEIGDLFFTDPPYYDAIPYSDLSDLCYIWLKKMLSEQYPDLFKDVLTPKSEEIVVNLAEAYDGRGIKDHEYYTSQMTKAFIEGSRALKENGIGVIVFAHKSTSGWESLVKSIVDAGLVVTASWPIDTERAARMRAHKSAALGSSVHIVVRKKNKHGITGEWRDVLNELYRVVNNWMKRLAKEGIVGADAIFACIGPALEIFTNYERVEKASGEKVNLNEFLEYVWGSVSKAALNIVFEGADASGFEEDSRITAMWLWTLLTSGSKNEVQSDEVQSGENDPTEKNKKIAGFSLDYDTSRKICQSLGIHLDRVDDLIEIKGDEARLISVIERVDKLFNRRKEEVNVRKGRKNTFQQLSLFEDDDTFIEDDDIGNVKIGETVLDRLHQSMLMFALGKTDALKRFIVDDGVGNDTRFWALAQALSALYPKNSDEKRWVDGILARKKSFGF